MGILWVFSNTGTFKTIPVPELILKKIKKKHKTTIDNDAIKNLFGHIPCKRRSLGRNDKKTISHCHARS